MNLYRLRADDARAWDRRRKIEGRENCTIERYADERYDLRMVPADLAVQHFPAFEIFDRTQGIDSRAGPSNQICNPESPFRKPIVIFVGDRLRHQSRFVQELPKSVGVAGEVMPRDGRPHSWVDSDEQHA